MNYDTMNYANNRVPISPAYNETPALLSKFKDTIQYALDDVPFFMLPVRLETRFMKDVMRDLVVEQANPGLTLLKPVAEGTIKIMDDYAVYPAFKDDTAFEAGIEIKNRVSEVLGTLGEFESVDPASRAVLKELSATLSSSFETASVWLLSKCTDPDMNEDLAAEFENVISDLNQLDSEIDELEDGDWLENVSENLTENSLIADIKDNNDNWLSQLYEGSIGINDMFGLFIDNNNTLKDAFNTVNELDDPTVDDPNPFNRIYLWAELQAIEEQFKTFAEFIDNPEGGQPIEEPEYYKMQLFKLTTDLKDEWIKLNGTLSKVWFERIPDADTLTQSQINGLSSTILDFGSDLEETAGDLIKEIIDSTWDSQKFDQYIGILETIPGALSGFPDNETVNKYLSLKLDHVNNQLATLFNHLERLGTKLSEIQPIYSQSADPINKWFELIPEVEELTSEQFDLLPQEIVDLANKISDSISDADGILSDIQSQQHGNWDDELFHNYVNKLNSISNDISSLPIDDSISATHIRSALDPLGVQFTDVDGVLTEQDWEAPLENPTVSVVGEVVNPGVYNWYPRYPVSTPKKTFPLSVKQHELWIRVYPDDIAIHTHEEKLTAQEKQSGIDYWQSWYNANNNPKKQVEAWRALVSLYGVERSAYIIKRMFPTNFSTGGSTGGSTTYANSTAYYQAANHLTLLNSYNAQLQGVEWDTNEPAFAQSHLDFMAPHIQYAYDTVAAMEELPAAELAELTTLAQEFTGGFSELNGNLATVFGESVLSLGETEYYINEIETAIGNIQSAASWSIIYNSPPTFPTNVPLKDSGWTETPCSKVMPSRFLFAAINHGPNGIKLFRRIKLGNKIPDPLYTGITPKNDPNNPDPYKNVPATNNLEIADQKIKWMFDFNEAINKGMATYLPLTSTDMTNGFDRLLVLGVKLEENLSTPNIFDHNRNFNKARLEELLENHHYTRGLGILRQGTPTNNTDNSNAGYQEPDPFSENSFNIHAVDPLFTPTSLKLNRRDGQWLADALGIEYSVVQNIDHADKLQISNAIAMNRALWPATAGNFMSEMMFPVFTEDNVTRTKAFFTDYVLGRGTIPAIRVGNQPYGILPVTSFANWGVNIEYSADESFENHLPHIARFQDYEMAIPPATQPLISSAPDREKFFQDRFNLRIYNVLEILNKIWLSMAHVHVKTVDRLNSSGSSTNKQTDFIEMLGQDAIMAEAATRFLFNDLTKQNISNLEALHTLNIAHNKWDVGAPNSNSYNIAANFTALFNDFNLTGNVSGSGSNAGIWDMNTSGMDSRNYSAEFFERITTALRVVHYEKSYSLRGPTVDEKLLSEKDPISALTGGSTYIQWLLDATLENVWKDNQFGNMQSRSLLFLLMRQATLLTYRNEAWNMLSQNGVFTKDMARIIGMSFGNGRALNSNIGGRIITKWHLLFNSINTISAHTGYNTSFNHFANTVTPTWSNQKLSVYLKASPTTGIHNFREAMMALRTCPTAELDRLMREHIDLCSYRLDAWNYGMVNQRLWKARNVDATRQKGIYLGAYGWLFNVRPKATTLANVKESNIPAALKDSTAPTYFDATNLGLIHTPSINHALTAALLRSAYVSENNSNEDNKFAVNLNSERVQMALSLLEGIRNGQTLGALLGYEFERGLHEYYASGVELDQYITSFRKEFPLVPEQNLTSTTNKETRLFNVVDGVALLNHVHTSVAGARKNNPDYSIIQLSAGTYPYGLPGLPTTGTEKTAIIEQIDRINNAMDALGDLMVAEGVFQLAKGNTARSAAVMEAITEGKNPPLPEIIETPRTGTHLTHRVVSLVQPVSISGLTSPWTGITLSPRAKAEPGLNKWVAELLAAPFNSSNVPLATFPTKIGCKVTYNDQDDLPAEFSVKLSDLNIQPLDLLYMVLAGDYSDELAKRISYFVRGNATNYYTSALPSTITGIPKDVPLTILYKDKGSASGVLYNFQDILTIVSTAADLVRGSKHLKASDFINTPNPTTANPAVPIYDLTELESRLGSSTFAGGIFADFATLYNYFDTAALPTNDSGLTALKTKLIEAAAFGIEFAFPASRIEAFSPVSGSAAIGSTAHELFAISVKVKEEITKRNNKGIAIMSGINQNDPDDQKVEKHMEVASIILGGDFKVLPQFSFNNFTGLKTAIADQLVNYTSGNDILRNHIGIAGSTAEMVMDDWLYGTARIQEKMDMVETVRMLTLEDNSHPLKTLRPVQMPYTANDYWLGMEYPATYTPTGDKLSVTVINSNTFNASNTYFCGFIIDEWTEMIPLKEEMTGITFHYDQPSAKPPQNALLMVHPKTQSSPMSFPWTLEIFLYTLLDTMDMAKIRMVEPDHFKTTPSPSVQMPQSTVDKFEIFKWLLPAVVGEITPHDINESSGVYSHVNYRGKNNLDTDDSTQQVSFEYNVNNNPPPVPGGSQTPPPSGAMLSFAEMDSDILLGDTELQASLNNEIQNTEITRLQNQLNENLPQS